MLLHTAVVGSVVTDVNRTMSWYRYLVGKGFIVATIDYSRGYKAGIEVYRWLLEAVEYLSKRLEALGIDKQISDWTVGRCTFGLLSASRILIR